MTDEEIIEAFRNKRKDNLKKAVIRPKFRLYKELMQIAVFSLLTVVTAIFGSSLRLWQFTILLTIVILLFLITQTKNIILLMIFLYQRFAPKTVRAACLFTPSCSEYMRISVQKYGVFKGVKKGFRRLKRCRPPNGGLDEP
ncbi:MAG: membrane protein insertion efficiency factor YidD [Ruminococcus sp.]|nr:membrane protein insertion efficiency factor YidD [Ruminococcus sp.]